MDKITRIANVSSGDLLSYYTDSNLNNLSFSSLDIKNELGKPVIKPRFRLSILNPDETVKTVIPQQDIVEGGSYSENYQSGQRRNVSITLYNQLGIYTPSINGLWASTKFLFEMGIELESGIIIWFPKGVYQIESMGVSHEPGNKTVQLELSDKFAVLEGSLGKLENTYTIPPGILIEDVIRDILFFGTGNGEMLDPKPFIYHSSFKGKRTQATITKEAGDTFGSIISDLATMLSAEVFYDIEGHLTFVPIVDVTADGDKPLIFDFYQNKGDFGSNNLNFDMSSIINRVVVVGGNINGEICDAIAVNDDPASPLCYQRIGYRTASPINDSNITSKILAEERANYELRQQLILKSSVSNSVIFNPLLMVNNLISVTDDFYNLREEKFLIQSISCNIDGSGSMSITTSNVRNLPFVVGG